MSANPETLLREAAIDLQRVEDLVREERTVLDLVEKNADFRGILKVITRLEELSCHRVKIRRKAILN